jgi:hypothetical protein
MITIRVLIKTESLRLLNSGSESRTTRELPQGCLVAESHFLTFAGQ